MTCHCTPTIRTHPNPNPAHPQGRIRKRVPQPTTHRNFRKGTLVFGVESGGKSTGQKAVGYITLLNSTHAHLYPLVLPKQHAAGTKSILTLLWREIIKKWIGNRPLRSHNNVLGVGILGNFKSITGWWYVSAPMTLFITSALLSRCV